MGKQSLSQIQKLQQNLSPQQIQLMKLIEVPTMELESCIKDEIVDNPALELNENADEDEVINEDENFDEDENEGENEVDDEDEYEDNEKQDVDDQYDSLSDIDDYLSDDEFDDASYKYEANNTSPDDEHFDAPITNDATFQDLLIEQLGFCKLDERKQAIGEYIIGNLDDSGYLKLSIRGISDDLLLYQNLDVSEGEIREVLTVIQGFDPAGVGAQNLQQCLLIQLQRLENEDFSDDYENAIKIIRDYYQDFAARHYDKITAKSGMSNGELRDAMSQIMKLNPKPGGTTSTSSHNTNYVIPDFKVYNNGNNLEISLDSRNKPELRISNDYKEMLREYAKKGNTKENREAITFIKDKIDSAQAFINNVNQRENTLYSTMKAITDFQREYFITGDESKLKPMILKDIADVVGLDVSTISRVARSKYVQTAFGTFPLKFFFSEGITNDEGETVSTREIMQIIKNSVDAEDKNDPLTDDELTAILKEKGFTLARRTTAKYREQLGFPVSRLRKEL